MELHEKIAAMREYIQEHGWCQWRLKDEQGRVCIVGADDATYQGYHNGPYVGHFLAKLAVELGLVEELSIIRDEYGNVFHYDVNDANIAFNNHPDTTENDVIEFLGIAEIRAKELA